MFDLEPEMELSIEDLPLLAEVQQRAKELGMPLAAALKLAFIGWLRDHSQHESAPKPEPVLPTRPR